MPQAIKGTAQVPITMERLIRRLETTKPRGGDASPARPAGASQRQVW
jgi:hypothetical protein